MASDKYDVDDFPTEKFGEWIPIDADTHFMPLEFGEMLDPADIANAQHRLVNTDVLFIVGTSGVVQPAASMGYIAKDAGANIIEVNIEATPLTGMADTSLFGKAGEILPKIFEPLLGGD